MKLDLCNRFSTALCMTLLYRTFNDAEEKPVRASIVVIQVVNTVTSSTF